MPKVTNHTEQDWQGLDDPLSTVIVRIPAGATVDVNERLAAYLTTERGFLLASAKPAGAKPAEPKDEPQDKPKPRRRGTTAKGG